VEISSIVDTWLFVRAIELGGERNRALYVLKSRGMAHSNQLREFLLTPHGIDLLDVYVDRKASLPGRLASRRRRGRRQTLCFASRSPSAGSGSGCASGKLWRLVSPLSARNSNWRKEKRKRPPVQEISREKLIAASREAMSRSRRADQTAGLSRSKSNLGERMKKSANSSAQAPESLKEIAGESRTGNRRGMATALICRGTDAPIGGRFRQSKKDLRATSRGTIQY